MNAAASGASSVESEVLSLCRELIHPSVELDTRLIDEGLLDSLHTLKLITRLEEGYGLTIDLASLEAPDLESPRAIAELVGRRRAPLNDGAE